MNSSSVCSKNGIYTLAQYVMNWGCTSGGVYAPLCLHAYQVRVTVGDHGLCCCTRVRYFKRQLTLLCVDSIVYGQPVSGRPDLNGKLNWRCKLNKKYRKSANIFLSACFIWLFYQYLYKKRAPFFCIRFELLRVQPRWLLFTNEVQKRVGLWRIWWVATRASLRVYAHHWRRLMGTKWQHSWWCFCDFQVSILNRMRNQLLYVSSFFCFKFFIFFYSTPVKRPTRMLL